MKNIIREWGLPIVLGVVVTLYAFMLSGCPSLQKVEHPIEASNVAPLWTKVLTRYETYVVADESLSDNQEAALLLDSNLLSKILSTALGE